MSNRPSRVTATALTVLLTAGSGAVLASPGQAATPAERATVLTTTLTHSGDSNGSGAATIRLMTARKRVCADMSWRRIQKPAAAHIHQLSDGAVVVDLTPSLADGTGCTTGVRRSIIRAIIASPRKYYVNVHNASFPAGAIQGTLHR
jgi:hypothetical protein